ncbi:MAG: phenylphosphate carboxylase subunit delta [Ahniella sp.]|nr:phenylphosphate carboxylase subunit delta [Ahniella sp.]
MSLLDLPAEVLDRARRIRLIGFDIDGVMTDGGLNFSGGGELYKRCNVQDGLGLKLLMKSGITVVIITGRSSDIVARRAADLGIDLVFQGVPDKCACMKALLDERDLDWHDAAYMGDDWPDLGVLRRVGLAIAPSNVDPAVAMHVHWRTGRRGGDGAVREAAELLLIAQDRYDALLAEHL